MTTSRPSEDGIAGRVEPYEDAADGADPSDVPLGMGTEPVEDDRILDGGEEGIGEGAEGDGPACRAWGFGADGDDRDVAEAGRRNQPDEVAGGRGGDEITVPSGTRDARSSAALGVGTLVAASFGAGGSAGS